jgi:prepilin-type N-terminal cleavage/methylation domain-containing protein
MRISLFGKLRKSGKVGSCGWRSARGMTLIELMIAMGVLAIGLPATMLMLVIGIQADSSSKTDTTATVLDQEVIEKFTTLKNYPKNNTVNIYDCSTASGATGHYVLGNLYQGATPGSSVGAATNAAGNIDWTQAAPALATSAAAGYAMHYQTCSGETYEVRWSIYYMGTAAAPSKLSILTVSARPLSAVSAAARGTLNQAILYAQPVTLRTMIESQ